MAKLNLGAVTAYADAVKGGFTGTREEFGEWLANAGKNAAAVAANLEESKKVLAEVNTAGETQVKAVQDEGAAQVKAVDDAANEKKTEIADMDAVQFDVPQDKSDAQKTQARTNIDAASQKEVDSLSKAIADLFCEVGDFYKVDLLSKRNAYQGGIKVDFTIDSSITNRVAFKVPLPKNTALYLTTYPLRLVDCVVLSQSVSQGNPQKTAYIANINTGDKDSELLFSLKKSDNSELLVSDSLLENCHLYRTVERERLSVNGLLKQGYYSFTSNTYVDSTTRACLQSAIGTDKVYAITVPDNSDIVIREVALYKDGGEKTFVCQSAQYKQISFLGAGIDVNKVQVIFTRTNPDDAISVSDCENIIFAEVY